MAPVDVSEPRSHAELAQELPLLTDAGRSDLPINKAGVLSEIGLIDPRQEFRTPSYAIGKAAQNVATSLPPRPWRPAGSGWQLCMRLRSHGHGGARAQLAPSDSVARLLLALQPWLAEPHPKPVSASNGRYPG